MARCLANTTLNITIYHLLLPTKPLFKRCILWFDSQCFKLCASLNILTAVLATSLILGSKIICFCWQPFTKCYFSTKTFKKYISLHEENFYMTWAFTWIKVFTWNIFYMKSLYRDNLKPHYWNYRPVSTLHCFRNNVLYSGSLFLWWIDMVFQILNSRKKIKVKLTPFIFPIKYIKLNFL